MAKHDVQSWSAEKHGSDPAARDRVREDRLPRLAMDGILSDYSLPMSGGKTVPKKEPQKAKMAHIMTNQELQSHTKKLVARLLGQDAAVDDETAARIKEFLSDKLSDKDHTALCAMLNGEDNVEAEDIEPPPDNVELPKPAVDRRRAWNGMGADDERRHSARQRLQAADSFARMYPDAAKIRIDNSGIQPPPARAASYSADGAASFAATFPDSARIKLL